MCTKRGIDDILKEIEESQDPDHIRRLLEEINACNKCPENLQGQDGQESECRCRQHFQTELRNYIYSISYQKK
jgi:hypothetical protein